MNMRMKTSVATLAAAAAVAIPVPALAETASGFALLIPKATEFLPALLAFLIIVAILAKLAWPMIDTSLAQRESGIADSIDASRATYDAAQAELDKALARLAESNAQVDAIIDGAHKEASIAQQQILVKAHEEANRIVQRANATLARERAVAKRELSEQAVDLSVGCARHIIQDNLNDEASQRELIERYLAWAGDRDGE